jgi:hypothetical protein
MAPADTRSPFQRSTSSRRWYGVFSSHSFTSTEGKRDLIRSPVGPGATLQAEFGLSRGKHQQSFEVVRLILQHPLCQGGSFIQATAHKQCCRLHGRIPGLVDPSEPHGSVEQLYRPLPLTQRAADAAFESEGDVAGGTNDFQAVEFRKRSVDLTAGHEYGCLDRLRHARRIFICWPPMARKLSAGSSRAL